MRSTLGRLAAVSLGGVVFVAGTLSGTAAGTADPTTTVETTVEPADETATSTTTTTLAPTTTTTLAPTTTTEAPPDLVVELPPPPARVTPSRGTAVQVTETLPPPTTTTTTTTTTIPDWVLPANSGSGRRVVYSKSAMRVWTVESDGNVSKTHLVSGRRTWNQPLPGTYNVFSRSSFTCNINNPHICWRYMVRFTKGPEGDNIGFHEIPTDTRTGYKLQSISQLGQALSAGCVRQATPDAAYIWNWAPIGTKVVVLG